MPPERDLKFAQRLSEALDAAGIAKRARSKAISEHFQSKQMSLSSQAAFNWIKGVRKPDSHHLVVLASFANTTTDFLLGTGVVTSDQVLRQPPVIEHSPDKLDLMRMRLIRIVQSEQLTEDDLATLEYMGNHLLDIRKAT